MPALLRRWRSFRNRYLLTFFLFVACAVGLFLLFRPVSISTGTIEKISIVMLKSALVLSAYEHRGNHTYCYKESPSTIVFIDLTLSSETIETWLSIELCAFITAAIHNSQVGICILTIRPYLLQNSLPLEILTNIDVAPLDVEEILDSPAAYKWYRDQILNVDMASPHIFFELSDVLRYAYLYKYGGRYMDTDSWTLRTFPPLLNILAWEDENQTTIGNGVMAFEKGHAVLDAILDNLNDRYDSNAWASTGPTLTTFVANNTVDNSTYSVLAPEFFYPLHWRQYQWSFDPERTEYVKNLTRNSYAFHIYGKLVRTTGLHNEDLPTGSYMAAMYNAYCAKFQRL